MIMNDPLRGDLRARDRYGLLTGVLGEPRDDTERALLVMLARLLGDDEVAALIVLIERARPLTE